jgi:uncharacterized protein YegL
MLWINSFVAMRRKTREINTFSLSAIDLFACAMGAFVLLSLILFQYYAKTQKTVTPPPEEKVAQLEKALAEAKKEAAASKEESKNRCLAFLGIVTQAKSFVVLVDQSGSMKSYEGIVRRTLQDLFSQMEPDHRCQIIGFRGHVKGEIPPRLTPWLPGRQMSQMDDKGRTLASGFIEQLVSQFGGGTPTYLALQTALTYPAEAIFLMTDGEPNDIEDGDEIIERITQENGGKKKIYCIAIGNYRKLPVLVQFLDDLARKNNGKFLGVSD